MGEIFSKIKDSTTNFINRYSKKQKIVFLAGSFLIVLVLTLSIFYVTRPEYVVLYKELKPQETGSITQNLDELGVKYKIKDESTILVSQEDVSKARIDLSMKGIPSPKFSYEDMLNRNNIFLSKEEKEQAFNIALQNSLVQDIESMPGIESAIVNLSIPQKSDFILSENKENAKAAVWIKTDPKEEFELDRVNGIATFISNSVEGLEEENVTIHDSSGKVLNGKNEEKDSLSNNQTELQEEVKNKLQSSLMEFLGPAYGYSNVSIMASVRLGFDSNVLESRTFNTPIEGEQNGLIRSLDEKSSNTSQDSTGGAAGTPTNTDDIEQYVEGDQAASSFFQNEKIINYELNETIQKIEKAKGQIEEVTVGIIINSDILEGNELDDEQRKQIQKIVSTAVGLNAKAVEIYARSFDNSVEKMFESRSENTNEGMPVWMMALIGLLIIIPLAAVIVVFLRNRNKKRNEIESEPFAMIDIPEDEIKELEVDIKDSGYKKSIETLIDRNPEIASQLLKSWLSED